VVGKGQKTRFSDQGPDGRSEEREKVPEKIEFTSPFRNPGEEEQTSPESGWDGPVQVKNTG